jgi:ABC-2 type transport system ATP-binding protein
MKNKTILRVNNLKKDYKDLRAVRGISFEVHAGEIVGLLGPNGAGKTTTISMLLGVLEPTSGTIEILGKNPKINNEVMSTVNFTTVSVNVPGNMSVKQNLQIFGRLYNVKNLKEKISSLIKELSLNEFENKKVGVLSSGEQTRVALAKALINSPQLLLLDEPTASLDPSAAYLIRDQVKMLASKQQTAILLTSHNMHEVEALCDRVLFLSHGKILLTGDPKTLPATHNKKNLEELFIAIAREPLVLEAT